MTVPQVLTALWEILNPSLKVLEPCSGEFSTRPTMLRRLLRVVPILEKAAPAVDKWNEFVAEISQLTNLLLTDATVATWKDGWTQLSLGPESVIRSTTPQNEEIILRAVTSCCKQLIQKFGEDQERERNATASSPPTSTKAATDETSLTFTSFTPVPRTTGEGHALAEASTTTGLTEWLSNASTRKQTKAGGSGYSYIYKRTGDSWNKSILHAKVDPGTIVMGCSLSTVGADGWMNTVLDMKIPVKPDGPEIAALQEMEKKLKFNMALNASAVEKRDSETERTGSSAWEKQFPKRFKPGSRTTYRH